MYILYKYLYFKFYFMLILHILTIFLNLKLITIDTCNYIYIFQTIEKKNLLNTSSNMLSANSSHISL
jgi:hypothetical protein